MKIHSSLKIKKVAQHPSKLNRIIVSDEETSHISKEEKQPVSKEDKVEVEQFDFFSNKIQNMYSEKPLSDMEQAARIAQVFETTPYSERLFTHPRPY